MWWNPGCTASAPSRGRRGSHHACRTPVQASETNSVPSRTRDTRAEYASGRASFRTVRALSSSDGRWSRRADGATHAGGQRRGRPDRDPLDAGVAAPDRVVDGELQPFTDVEGRRVRAPPVAISVSRARMTLRAAASGQASARARRQTPSACRRQPGRRSALIGVEFIADDCSKRRTSAQTRKRSVIPRAAIRPPRTRFSRDDGKRQRLFARGSAARGCRPVQVQPAG